MEATASTALDLAGAGGRLAPAPPAAMLLAPPPAHLEPVTPAELRALVHAGENESDACERLLAQVARAEGALDLAIGAGLAALTVGERLVSLGFSCLRDYAREILDLEERNAQALAHLSRELRSRPLLRAAVRAGESASATPRPSSRWRPATRRRPGSHGPGRRPCAHSRRRSGRLVAPLGLEIRSK